MSRLNFTLYLIILSLSVIFMFGFFKETFLLNSHSFGTVDPLPAEMYGVQESSEDRKRTPLKVHFRRLLNGEGKRVISKKSPFLKETFFKFLDLGRKDPRKNPVEYGLELFKYLLGQEYAMDGEFNWASAAKYDPKKVAFPKNSGVSYHPIAPGVKVGENVTDKDVRQIHIATSWRSGSTFLGDLLNHITGTYYSFEPLHVESLTMSTERRLELMKAIFQCDFKNKETLGWIRHASKRENNFLYIHNFRSFKVCSQLLPGKVACFMDKFQGPVCAMTPIRVIKTVRLRVAEAETFLSNKKDFPNYKMVVLVRDPRGTMHSRSSRAWCSGDECSNSSVVCQNLLKDAESANALAEKYPGRVYLIRYEDICIRPHEEIRSLFDFLNIPLSKGLSSFVQKHMFQGNNKNPYSTYRNSNSMYMKWRKTVDMSYIHKIQSECSDPMSLLGYRSFSNLEDRDNFELSVLSKESESLWPKSASPQDDV